LNILISSAGRRVGLIECFRSALASLGQSGKILAADATDTAPALHFADVTYRLPRCSEQNYIPALISACQKHQIDVIVPTIDTELAVLAEHRQRIEASGAHLWLSCAETIEITADKRKTNRWLRDNGFPTVEQLCLKAALSECRRHFVPLIAKPARGSASVGVKRIDSALELEALHEDDIVVERVAPGIEYTVHVWANAYGQAKCAVPCRRLEVRAGEVSKGRTEKHAGLMQLAKQIVEALPGCRGPINVQNFLDTTGDMKVIEVNPRFGGGYPLVDRAGASFTRQMLGASDPLHDDWTHGITMLRYDAAVFIPPTG
jgi:carbamoyl-phosphate synthase large subunit